MLEIKDHLFIGRDAVGHVRLLKLPEDPGLTPGVRDHFPQAILDITINEQDWALALAYCCERGDSKETFALAYEFHQGIPFGTKPEDDG